MNMNKILIVLIIGSGFLVIFYANNDIFTRKNLFSAFQKNENNNNNNNNNNNDIIDYIDINLSSDLKRVKYIPKVNTTEYNIFVIYTKETYILKSKFELFLKSLIKYTTIKLHLHIITDEKSELSAENVLRNQIERYKKTIFYTLYDVEDCSLKISDIVYVMLPYFSSNPGKKLQLLQQLQQHKQHNFTKTGSYYSDALFYLSLGLHKIVDRRMRRAILIDCDVVFRTDVKELFDEFDKFSPDALFGLAPELTPVYRHILYKYRAQNPRSNFGNPYYPNSSTSSSSSSTSIDSSKKRIKHGYPGLNSGVVMLNFDKIRHSKLYAENLKQKNIQRMVNKYSFKGHLGDQDYFTLIGYEFPGLIYQLDCCWNKQLCTWWKEHGYSLIFDSYFHCEGKIRLYHGNCNTRIPE